jgi:caffeoyl-CoA O-methyltransferase
MLQDPAVDRYLHRLQQAPTPLLDEMGRLGEDRGFPIVGPLVGRLLEQLARSIWARTVFELGSGFGYSTAWFLRALPAGGRIVHTETSPELQAEARDWLTKAKPAARIDYRSGNAVDLLEADTGPYDLVFLDLDKEDYPKAWALARQRIRVCGLVVADNALWHGKVAGKARDAATEAIRTYNRLAHGDADFLTTLLPVRDGVSVSLRLR